MLVLGRYGDQPYAVGLDDDTSTLFRAAGRARIANIRGARGSRLGLIGG